MHNSQSSRIGSCKWHDCSCQSGEVGENINGQFYCVNCGHQINHHYPTNDNINNNMLHRNQNNVNANNGTIPQFNRSIVQNHNFNNFSLGSQN